MLCKMRKVIFQVSFNVNVLKEPNALLVQTTTVFDGKLCSKGLAHMFAWHMPSHDLIKKKKNTA